MADPANDVAFVAQDFIEPSWLSDEPRGRSWLGAPELPPLGRARAHIEGGPEATAPLEESEWDTLDEAIAWARSHVRQVCVRVGYSDYYSAGTQRCDNLLEWPPSNAELSTMSAAYPAEIRGPDQVVWYEEAALTASDTPKPSCLSSRSSHVRVAATSRDGERLTLHAGQSDGEPWITVKIWHERGFPVGGGGAGGGTRLKRDERLRVDLGSSYEEGMYLYLAGRAGKDVKAVVAVLDDGSSTEAHLVPCDDLPYNVFVAVPPAERWIQRVEEP